MASRSRRGGGGGGTFQKFFWALALLGLIFAFYQIPYDPGAKGLYEVAASKSETVKKWAEGVGPAIGDFISRIIRGGEEAPGPKAPPPGPGGSDNGSGGSGGDGSTGGGGLSDVENQLNSLTVAGAANVNYNRDEWNHWTNVRSCWSTREQVLAEEAVPGSLVLKDKNGNAADLSNACEIVSGSWVDPYTGKTFTNPKDLDIDHMIPLKYAATHGGQGWDAQTKQDYANDLVYSNHLVAVDKGANRSKSDKGPAAWKPSNQAYWCEYAKSWVHVASTWSLSVTEQDKNALRDMLATCSG